MMAKSARDRLAAKARKMTTEAQKAEWRAAWLALRLPDGVDYDAARETMLRALVDGKTIAEAIAEAIAAVLPPCPVPLPQK
jgi:hypothetical protein